MEPGRSPPGCERVTGAAVHACKCTMKSRVLAIPLVGLALSLPATSLVAAAQPASPSPTPAVTQSGWEARWQKLEDRLDGIFRDTVKELHSEKTNETPAFSSSIDVREEGDAYVARMYLPKKDEGSANITLSRGMLKISAGDAKAGGYEESVELPGPVQQDKMKIDHKEGVLVVTIPKAKKSDAVAQSSPAVAPIPSQDTWDRDILREMQRMQDRMDQLTKDVFADSNVLDAGGGMFLNSTVKVDDQKDKYVVHFYLPDRNAANFKVNLKDNNELQITGSQESRNTTGNSTEYSSGSYEQEITLPGPVQAGKMKVDRKEGMVTVTLPKAG